MATAKQRNNKDGSVSYEIRVSLGRDLNNKQILKYYTWTPEPNMTQRQIDKTLEREKVLFEERCRSGQVLDTGTKFADFAEKWLEVNKDSHSPKYQKGARDLLLRVNAAIGHMQIGKIRPHHLQEFYSNLAEAGVKKVPSTAVSEKLADYFTEKSLTRKAVADSAGISPATVIAACQGKRISLDCANKIAAALCEKTEMLFDITKKRETLSANTVLHYHRIISTILEAAVKWQAIYDNPARRVQPPKVPKKEAAYLDDKQSLQVIEALASEPLKWRVIIMLLMYSGMRRGEACGLTWDDIDFTNSLIHINKANQYLSGRGVFEKETKTTSSERVIKLPKEMFELFRSYKSWQAGERLKIGDGWENSGKVFTQENGLPMHPDSVTGWVSNFREKHQLPHFTPHSLRHTSATLLIMQGVPVKAVSARLGHADQNVTNAVYAHTIQTADAVASDVIGDILGKKKQAQ